MRIRFSKGLAGLGCFSIAAQERCQALESLEVASSYFGGPSALF